MTDSAESGLQVRQSPRKRAGDVRIVDFTMMVRVPDRPDAVRVYTDADRDEAARYAAEVDGTLMSLPLAPPAGYTSGPDGTLVPSPALTGDRPDTKRAAMQDE